MRINLNKAYTPQAGDIISWISGKDKILFVVTSNTVESEYMIGVTLFDNRDNGVHGNVHIVSLKKNELNYRLHLILEADKVFYNLDQILEEWRTKNG